MRSQLVIGLVMGAALLAACSSTPSPAPTTSGATTTPTGTLTGTLLTYGGALNPTTGKMANNGSPDRDTQVKVLSGTHVVATKTTDSKGQVTFDLAPGKYTLDCEGAKAVTVRAGARVYVECDEIVP